MHCHLSIVTTCWRYGLHLVHHLFPQFRLHQFWGVSTKKGLNWDWIWRYKVHIKFQFDILVLLKWQTPISDLSFKLRMTQLGEQNGEHCFDPRPNFHCRLCCAFTLFCAFAFTLCCAFTFTLCCAFTFTLCCAQTCQLSPWPSHASSAIRPTLSNIWFFVTRTCRTEEEEEELRILVVGFFLLKHMTNKKTLSQNGSVGSEISQRDDEAKLLKVTQLLKTSRQQCPTAVWCNMSNQLLTERQIRTTTLQKFQPYLSLKWKSCL